MGINLKMKTDKSENMADGAITLFLSIVLLVVLSLICTVAESTRLYLAMVHSKSQGFRAVETEFAGYAKQLFDDYGILALFEQEKIDDRVRGNIELENKFDEDCTNLISTNFDEADRLYTKYITDYGGEDFIKQVLEYEKYEATEETINFIITRFRKYKDNETDEQPGNEQTDSDEQTDPNEQSDSDEQTDPNEQIEEDEQEHVNDYDNASSLYGKEYIESIRDISRMNLAPGDTDAEEKRIFFAEARADIYDAVHACDDYIEAKKQIEKKYGKSELNLYEEENRALLQDILLQTEIISAKYMELVDEPAAGGAGEAEIELGRQQFLAVLSECEENILSCQSRLTVIEEPIKTEEDKKNESILDAAKKLIEEGPVGLVVPSDMEISKKTVKTDKLPTTVCEEKKNSGILGDIKNKAVFAAYIYNNFGCVLSAKKDTALDYEMEYIVGGKDSDKANLESVAARLVLIRQIPNNITLMSDTAKMECLSAMAASISCSVCMPYLEPLIKLILIEAWALAESVADVRTLLGGGEVSLIKKHSEWKTSLDNLLAETIIPDKKEKDGVLKQDYNMYLIILLMTMGEKNLVYRTMDLIQLNICKRYNSDFRMIKCITKLEYDMKFTLAPVFAALPFIPGKGEDGYCFKIRTGYSY